MPPRYVYWTIIVDGQPTAFRSGSLEDIMPTFNRLKEKQPSAELKWFQNGQLWASRHDAQDFMRARGERGRSKDPRQSKDGDTDVASGFSRTDRPERAWNAKPEWKTRSTFKARSDKPAFAKAPARPAASKNGERPEWKPKGTFKPKEAGHASGWGEKPAWKPKADADKPAWKPKSGGASGFPVRRSPGEGGSRSSGDKPAWKPKGTFKPREEGHRPTARDQARSSFKPKSYTPKVDDGRTRSSRVQSRNDKLEWQPKGAASRDAGPNAGFARGKDGGASGFSRSPAEGGDRPEGKRKWVPKAEYKKSLGIEAKRDDKWRPGGEHKDPKQKYKDAKKAKWTKFKANIRARSTNPRKPKDD